MTNQSYRLHRKNIKRERYVGKFLTNRHSFIKFVTVARLFRCEFVSFDFFLERDIKVEAYINIERS